MIPAQDRLQQESVVTASAHQPLQDGLAESALTGQLTRSAVTSQPQFIGRITSCRETNGIYTPK